MEYKEVDFDEYPLTESEVIAILGNDYKEQGQELVWRCPACPNGDKHGDNLKFNRQKHVLKCFACDYGKDVTGIIARRRFEFINGLEGKEYHLGKDDYEPISSTKREDEKPKEITVDNLPMYYLQCNQRLFSRKDVLLEMWKKHTIMPKTALDCLIGYDDKKDMLLFPSRAIKSENPNNATPYNCEDNGGEYREYQGEKKVRRIAGYNPRIVFVYGNKNYNEAILCEGYKDAYNMVQILKIEGNLDKYAIFTVQNGTNSINADNCLKKINWNTFEKVHIVMDRDDAGNEATSVAINMFPNLMTDSRDLFLKQYGDVQERFKGEYASRVNIDKMLSATWIDELANGL